MGYCTICFIAFPHFFATSSIFLCKILPQASRSYVFLIKGRFQRTLASLWLPLFQLFFLIPLHLLHDIFCYLFPYLLYMVFQVSFCVQGDFQILTCFYRFYFTLLLMFLYYLFFFSVPVFIVIILTFSIP